MNEPAPGPAPVPPPLRRPELLAPAGDWACARAAVENGADAIYFGLDRFNARMRAHNFTEADLPALMEFLHRRGVRGYVTFNTLVFGDELAAATEYLRNIIAAGVDAAIVQDVGICRLIRRLSPDFPIHGSTQMTVTSAAGVALARELGCELVVLARENSLKEIAAIQAAQSAGGGVPLPLEVFVHGALCVAYSGQCLTSEALGGRSANRGECAQACRMPYELVSDGRPVELGDRRYLLSPQDLAGLEVLSELVKAGVASLKIEGRLKSPEYVAAITSVYRRALDRVTGEAGQPSGAAVDPAADRYRLEMAFSRGLHPGWFNGINNQELVHARFGKKRGVLVGEVTQVRPDGVVVQMAGPVKPGDGVGFDRGRPDEAEEGGRVYEVVPAGMAAGAPLTVLRFGHGRVDFRRIQPGHRVWKTSDPELERDLQASFAGDAPRFTRPVRMEVHGVPGGPLTLSARDAEGHVAQGQSAVPLARAERQPLTPARLREQLGRLGGTPLSLGDLTVDLDPGVILPVSELNRLRREVVADLERQRARPRRWRLNPEARPALVVDPGTEPEVATDRPAELAVLVRTHDQFEAALRAGVTTLYCEFEDPKRYREAVSRFQAARAAGGLPPEAAIWVAPPRITKPGEEWILRQVQSSGADGFLVRNADHLHHLQGGRRRGDFSLNVANPLAADFFRHRFSLELLTASYDLNLTQLEALLEAAPPSWFEVTIHQHMPMFHMEHCVFCAFLSKGRDYHDCGRPCDRHDLRLRDRVGREHPVRADAGCRNTVYNARAQTGAESVSRLLSLGVRHFRIEFVAESAAEVTHAVGRYRDLLAGRVSGADLWRELKADPQLGVTRGQLERVEERRVFPAAAGYRHE